MTGLSDSLVSEWILSKMSMISSWASSCCPFSNSLVKRTTGKVSYSLSTIRVGTIAPVSRSMLSRCSLVSLCYAKNVFRLSVKVLPAKNSRCMR